MSEEAGLMMLWGFYVKATNSLHALILHIVFNLLSLFSINCCPPTTTTTTLSPKTAPSRGPAIVDVDWKKEEPQFEMVTFATDVQPRHKPVPSSCQDVLQLETTLAGQRSALPSATWCSSL